MSNEIPYDAPHVSNSNNNINTLDTPHSSSSWINRFVNKVLVMSPVVCGKCNENRVQGQIREERMMFENLGLNKILELQKHEIELLVRNYEKQYFFFWMCMQNELIDLLIFTSTASYPSFPPPSPLYSSSNSWKKQRLFPRKRKKSF